MVVGTMALTGVPPFAGYYSKDMVIEAAHAAHSNAGLFAFWVGVIVAMMTAFYSWRLIFLVFHGERNNTEEVYAHAHESPKIMLTPMGILFVGSILAGIVFNYAFIGDGAHHFWGNAIAGGQHIIHEAHHSPTWVKKAPFFAMLIGFGLALWIYIARPGMAAKIRESAGVAYDIDGLSMGIIPTITGFYGRLQSGYVFHYALAMIGGVGLIIAVASTGGH